MLLRALSVLVQTCLPAGCICDWLNVRGRKFTGLTPPCLILWKQSMTLLIERANYDITVDRRFCIIGKISSDFDALDQISVESTLSEVRGPSPVTHTSSKMTCHHEKLSNNRSSVCVLGRPASTSCCVCACLYVWT